MSGNILLHTQHKINCAKFVKHFMQGGKYIRQYNYYLLPYQCTGISIPNRMIDGHFINPVWHTLERSMLSRGTTFKYTYMKGGDFIMEIEPSKFKEYHIFGKTYVYPNGIKACPSTLQPNSVLLFSVPCSVADPLIQHQLM
jgi:hypothetical protein